MHLHRSIRCFRRGALSILLAQLCSTPVFAVDPLEIRQHIEDARAKFQSSERVEADIALDHLESVLNADAAIAATPELTIELVQQAYVADIVANRMSEADVARLLSAFYQQPASQPSLSAEVTPALAYALLPYLIQDGLCFGSLWQPSGLVCSLTDPLAFDPASGTISSADGMRTYPFNQLAQDSRLAHIFSLARADAAANDDPTDIQGLKFDTSKSYLLVFRVSASTALALATSGAAAVTSLFTLSPLTILSSVADFLATVAASRIELYGEFYALATVKSLTETADSVFLVAPYGGRCSPSTGSCLEAARCFATKKGSDAFESCRQYIELKDWSLRGQGSYAEHRLSKGCGASEVPKEQSLSYNFFIENQNNPQRCFQNPVDNTCLRFQASHRGSPRASTPNLEPQSNTANAAATNQNPTWRYLFDSISSRADVSNYNFIFAGERGPTQCPGSLPTCNLASVQGSRVAFGNSFWAWHGAPRQAPLSPAVCGGSDDILCFSIYLDLVAESDRSMPEVDLIYGKTLVAAPSTQMANCPVPLNTYFSILDGAAVEGNSGSTPLNFTVVKAGNLANRNEVNFFTSNDAAAPNGTAATAGVDYQIKTQTVTLPINVPQVAVAVPILGDTLFEASENFLGNISSASSSNGPMNIFLRSSARGQIADNDTPLSCGNRLCELGETGTSCPQDCAPRCGDNLCETAIGETGFTCAPDCAPSGMGCASGQTVRWGNCSAPISATNNTFRFTGRASDNREEYLVSHCYVGEASFMCDNGTWVYTNSGTCGCRTSGGGGPYTP